MTVIGINGTLYAFDGPVTLRIMVCPVCRSSDIENITDLVPESVVLPEFRSGIICPECGAVFVGEEDLDQETRVYTDT
jgi:uncharacterized protein YbaR (Trm112 family)